MFKIVPPSEFDAFLRAYPRPLQVEPPLSRKARFRWYSDSALGPWPGNVVAKEFHVHRSATYEVRETAAK